MTANAGQIASRPIGLGIAGMGRAAMLALPAIDDEPRFRLVAVADPSPAACAQIGAAGGVAAYAQLDALLEDSRVDAVYVASPHPFHAAQAIAALRAGKHVLVEKPMALSLADCLAMQQAAAATGRVLMVGPSHGFDRPVRHAAELIASGAFGEPRLITAFNYTDFLYRPRRSEELDDRQGGGVVFSQGAHQIDVVRALAGRPVRSVRALAGSWDPARPSVGAYNAFLRFGGGLSATLTYSGYGRYDSDALQDWVGEFGAPRDPQDYAAARRRLAGLSPAQEAEAKRLRAVPGAQPARVGNNHFGFVLVSCERADLRLTPAGVEICANDRRWFEPVAPPAAIHADAFSAFAAAIGGQPNLFDGTWGAGTVQCCLALQQSSEQDREIVLGPPEGDNR